VSVEKLKAALPPEQVAQIDAAGIDWGKVFLLFQQLLPLILAILPKQPMTGEKPTDDADLERPPGQK
jgi:hypothetical protein